MHTRLFKHLMSIAMSEWYYTDCRLRFHRPLIWVTKKPIKNCTLVRNNTLSKTLQVVGDE